MNRYWILSNASPFSLIVSKRAPKSLHSLIYSLNRIHTEPSHMPGTVLGPGDMAMHNEDEVSVLMNLHSDGGDRQLEKIMVRAMEKMERRDVTASDVAVGEGLYRQGGWVALSSWQKEQWAKSLKQESVGLMKEHKYDPGGWIW